MVGKKDHIVVVDMDGTLVRGNTWRYFVAMILRKSLLNLRILTFFRLSILLIKRRIGKISHSELKYSVMRASHLFNGDDWQRFASKMSELFNEDVLRIIETEKENGACILMATAAAGEYAPIIADKAGITYSVFTPKAIEGVLYLELRGEKK